MKKYEMIVLAVSPSEGGYCLAGITPEGKFIRPIFWDNERESYSFPKEVIKDKGIKLFSLIEFWGEPYPKNYHPEDVAVSGLDHLKVKYERYYAWKKRVENLAITPEDFESYLDAKSFIGDKVEAKNYTGDSIFLLHVPEGTKISVRPHRSWDKPFSKEAFLILPSRRIKVTAQIDIWNRISSFVDLSFTEDSYVLVTLGRPFIDGYCYLLVSGILTEKPHEELFKVESCDPRFR
ncbi:dual OB domain-containing protein [Aquifex sp.]